jgi:hypothetical protein
MPVRAGGVFPLGAVVVSPRRDEVALRAASTTWRIASMTS